MEYAKELPEDILIRISVINRGSEPAFINVLPMNGISAMSILPFLPGRQFSHGNSNWRGPIWMPVNTLIIRALLQYHAYYGDNFKIECPTGSGTQMNLYQIAEEIAKRLTSIFLKNDKGLRPVYGGTEKFQEDPHWKDYILFYEYFHGDNGAGIGASHQTGWTGVIARSMHLFASTSSDQILDLSKKAAFIELDDQEH